MKKLIIIILTLSVFTIMGCLHQQIIAPDKVEYKTFYECRSGEAWVISDLKQDKDELDNVCKIVATSKGWFKRKYLDKNYYTSLKRLKEPLFIYYLTPRAYYGYEPTSDYAFCVPGSYSIYIQIVQPLFGRNWLTLEQPEAKNDLQFLLKHELYHVWSLDVSESNANWFAETVPRI